MRDESIPAIDILIPTYRRPAALAVTLTALIGQTFDDFRVIVSDQTEDFDIAATPELSAVALVLSTRSRNVRVLKHLPRRGMAEQRQFLLDCSAAPYVLYLDDDIILEPDMIERLVRTINQEACGFVGSAPIGLSYLEDVRVAEQTIEFWDGPVKPEVVEPRSLAWGRHKLHNAANVHHLARRLGLSRSDQRRYRVAWVGGCVLYDRQKLLDCGGFSFWPQLPAEHCGEDVLAQLRVMAAHGGCAILPSGAYHQELETTLPDRSVNAPDVVPVFPDLAESAVRRAATKS